MPNMLKRLLAGRQPVSRSAINEGEVLRATRSAFAGELPISRETLGRKEVLTIEPQPGHKIVVGSTARGKSAARWGVGDGAGAKEGRHGIKLTSQGWQTQWLYR